MIEARSFVKVLWVAVAAALVAATPAFGDEFRFGLNTNGEYNSNILGRAKNQRDTNGNKVNVIDAFVTHVGPVLRVKDAYGRLVYDASYRGDFTWYSGARNLDAWEQYLDAEVSYALSRQTTISLNESFRDVSSIRFALDEQDDFSDTLDGGRDKFIRNVMDVTLGHAFTRRLSVQLRVDNEQLDYKKNDIHTDSSFMGATGSMSYALTAQDRVGAGGGFTYQKFHERGFVSESRGQVWNSFLTWVHEFESNMKFSIQGGPSWIRSIQADNVRANQFLVFNGDQGVQAPCSLASIPVPGAFLESSCTQVQVIGNNPRVDLPLVGVDPTDTRLTFFGSASLVKRWEAWEFRASYTRRQSGASGDDSTSALDRALISANYDANRLWSLYASAGWSRRERLAGARPRQVGFWVTASPGSGPAVRVGVATLPGASRAFKLDQYNVILGSRRRLTKHLNIDGSFRYRYSIRTNTSFAARRAEYFIFGLTLQYVFDPVRF